jgi:hypothetical protein
LSRGKSPHPALSHRERGKLAQQNTVIIEVRGVFGIRITELIKTTAKIICKDPYKGMICDWNGEMYNIIAGALIFY